MHGVLTSVFLIAGVVGALGDWRCTNRGGNCQIDTPTCAGGYVSGLCIGAANRRCCLPSTGDWRCSNRGGNCQIDTPTCAGGYVSGLCSGAANRRCCLPSTGTSSSGSSCPGLTIVSRAQWGARAPRRTSNLRSPVDQVFVHHTDTPVCNSQSDCAARLRNIQSYHMDTKSPKWSDIGYSFLVDENGNIYEGRGWDRVGSHTRKYNSVSLAISFIGDYQVRTPGSAALDAVQRWLACGVSKGKITSTYKLYGHRDAGSTSCPGNSLYSIIQTWSHFDQTGKPHQ